MRAEQRVADALCEAYELDAEESDDPNYPIDRVFYHSTRKILDKDLPPEDRAREILQRKPSSIVEIKHRNRGRYGDVNSFLPNGTDYENGYMIDTDKIDNGIHLSEENRVPFFVVVALDGPELSLRTAMGHDPDLSMNVIVTWRVTAPTEDGSMTTLFPRLSGERETQRTVNGGRKMAKVDYLPCVEMIRLRDATTVYRRMIREDEL